MADKEVIEKLQRSNSHIQRLVNGEGRGIVITVIGDGSGHFEASHTHVRMSLAEALGSLDIIKQKMLGKFK